MPSTYTSNMLAIHDVDFYKVRQMVKTLIDKKKYCFPAIQVRQTNDNLLVVIDGVHRAVASCITNILALYDVVSENELLNDSDISSRNLYLISRLADNCEV